MNTSLIRHSLLIITLFLHTQAKPQQPQQPQQQRLRRIWYTIDIIIKPDGVQRGLIGEIIKRFEQKGYKLIAMKLTAPGQAHMETHYADLAGKKFFPGLIEYMTSGPVCECFIGTRYTFVL